MSNLDEISWASLRHAYGVATDVPALLRALTSADGDERSRALASLSSNIHHQGSVYSASTAAVPFLVDALAAECDHAGILALLLALALGDDANTLAWGRPFPGPEPPRRGAERRVYDAVAAGSAVYVTLLEHRSPPARAGATYLLGWLEPPAPGVVDALRARLDVETHPVALGSVALALGLLGEASATGRLSDLAAGDGVESLAAAAGLALSLRGETPEPVRERLRAAASARPVEPPRHDVPWHGGDLSALARKALLHAVPNDLGERLAFLLAELRRGAGGDVVNALIQTVFPGHRAYFDIVPPPVLLSAEQLKVLTALATTEPTPPRSLALTFRGLGVPDDHERLGRYLGLSSPSAADTAVDLRGGDEPIWRLWLRLGRGGLGPAVLSEAITNGVTDPTELLEAALCATRGDVLPNGLSGEVDDAACRLTETAIALVCEAGEPMLAPLRRAAERALSALAARVGFHHETGQREATIIVASLQSLLAARGEVLPEAHDPLVARAVNASRAAERALLASLPSSRAEAQVLARPFQIFGRERREGSRTSWVTEGKGAWWVCDLSPSPAVIDRVLAEVAEQGRGEWGIEGRVREVLAAFGAALVAPAITLLRAKPPRRDLILEGLADGGAAEAVPVLIDALSDTGKAVRGAAASGLARMPAEIVMPLLMDELSRAKGKRKKALEGVAARIAG